MSAEQLLEEVESLKRLFAAKATGELADDGEYQRLRQRLVTNLVVKERLPRFVRSCRNLGEFWSFIKEKDAEFERIGKYAGRRKFLADQFDPLLTFLEQSAATPSDDPVTQVLAKVDGPHVTAAWQKAIERRAADPEGAITAARTLIETVCKHILDTKGVPYGDADDLPKLYKATAESLNLSPSQHTEKVFRQILGGCHAVVDGLGAMRNRHSDAHGISKTGVRPAPRHAELAVNLAGTMATFLISTLEANS